MIILNLTTTSIGKVPYLFVKLWFIMLVNYCIALLHCLIYSILLFKIKTVSLWIFMELLIEIFCFTYWLYLYYLITHEITVQWYFFCNSFLRLSSFAKKMFLNCLFIISAIGTQKCIGRNLTGLLFYIVFVLHCDKYKNLNNTHN